MSMTRNCLILTQYRQGGEYNDFIGKFYHFPATHQKNYLKQFDSLPIEFIYFEPESQGKGEFYGYGKITKRPFQDKKNPDHFFVEISDYKAFSKPVYFKNLEGEILEKTQNPNHYNPNNAVRKIPSDFLDELCLDGGILLNFQADSHLVQVLGEQLIASERVGILELIKNAYDANAQNCTVRFEKIPSLPDTPGKYLFDEFDGPIIAITDDGNGMDKEIIEKGWLRPASTIKTNVKEAIKRQRKEAAEKGDLSLFNRWLEEYRKANNGRLPLGEKGVGRFATHRLGRKLLIKTKTKYLNYEYVLSINWDDFDVSLETPKNLDAVPVTLTRQAPSRNYGLSNSGTQIIIYGGREGFNLDKEILEEIHESVSKLNSPDINALKQRKVQSSNPNLFSAKIECPQIGEFVSESIYDLAAPVFSLDGIVDEHGVLNYDLTFNPPTSNRIPFPKEKLAYDDKLDLKIGMDGKNPFLLSQGKYRDPECGGFYIHLDLWYRSSPWIESINVKRVRELLDDYGGVSIYRDGMNLFPAEWGAEMDWLKLAKRHIKKGDRISYYSMMGYVELEQGKNINLVDKTDRQGLIENTSFNDLSHLVSAIVFRAELDYQQKRDSLTDIRKSIVRNPAEVEEVSSQASTLVENILTKYDFSTDPANLFESINSLENPEARQENLIGLNRSLKELEESVKQMRRVEERLVEEAGFGKSVAASIHELAKITTNLYNGIISVLNSSKPNPQDLINLKDASGSLRSELKNLSPLRTIRNEPRQEFLVSKSIEFIKEVFGRKLKSSDIELRFNKEEDFQIYARYGAINQIFSNLVDNSVYWLNTLSSDDLDFEKKVVEITLNAKKRSIIIADNGPGIHTAIEPYLFRSGASMRVPPSGLGLFISRHYMNEIRGDAYLTSEGDRLEHLKGAQFTLDFSRSPKSKDEAK